MAGPSGERIRPLAAAGLLAALTLGTAGARAASVTLTWDAVADPERSHYRLYHGPESGRYRSVLEVDGPPPVTIDGLPDGTTTYFALAAVDRSGAETGLSNEAAGPMPPLLFFEDFHEPSARLDPDWRRGSGRWRVSRRRRLVGSAGLVNRALLRRPGLFFAGRVAAEVRIGGRAAGRPNAGILFAYSGRRDYRYVKVLPGEIVIGQVGDAAGGSPGRKAAARYPVRAGRWHRLTVDVMPRGAVRVYVDDDPSPALSHRFPAAAAGGVGGLAARSRSSFDNFAVWDASLLR